MKTILLLLLTLPFILSDVTVNPDLIKKFEIIQITKGKSDSLPEYHGTVAVKIYVYNKNNELLTKAWTTFAFNSSKTPLCLDYVLPYMNEQERVMLKCPKEYGFNFTGAEMINLQKDFEQDLIIDIQVWKHGNSFKVIE